MTSPDYVDNIRVSLPRDLYDRLKKLCDHQGQQSHLIRIGVKLVVEREEAKLIVAKEPVSTAEQKV